MNGQISDNLARYGDDAIQGFASVTLTVPFGTRLKETAQQAILHGVYAAIVIAFVGLALLWLAGDYYSTKAQALNGQRAFEAIVRAEQQQRAAKTVEPGK